MTSADAGRRAVVIVASTRAAAGVYEDTTGPVIEAWLRERGWELDAPRVVPDGPRVGESLREAVGRQVDLVVTTGGTGLGPDDVTPEATAAILERQVPGFMEELRRRGVASTPTALLTRGLAGVAGGTFIVNLPGSRGGVADGLGVLDGVLDHILDQIAGGKHGH